jgi:hypothetical protein
LAELVDPSLPLRDERQQIGVSAGSGVSGQVWYPGLVRPRYAGIKYRSEVLITHLSVSV